tara:strand:+ start:86 stop:364 length:279 start_codon:yes stop_codon:yes gene_type:complete
MSDVDEDSPIALRLWDGDEARVTIRFAFSEHLMMHLENVEVDGSDGSTTTLGLLSMTADCVDFLREDVSPREHLSHGTKGAREQARLAWEAL